MDDRELIFLIADLNNKLKEITQLLDAFLEKTKPRTIEEIKQQFPKYLREQLGFRENDNCILIKPKSYLGSDTFREVAKIVKDQLHGEYISAGRDSHFRISKK